MTKSSDEPHRNNQIRMNPRTNWNRNVRHIRNEHPNRDDVFASPPTGHPATGYLRYDVAPKEGA